MVDKTEMMQTAMQIILHAGNGRTEIKRALVCLEEFDFAAAEQALSEAQEQIRQAHRAQTELIQSESRGEEAEFSILFVHAQDTLMTIKSEWNIAERLVGLTRSLDRRLSKLEQNRG
ncbi:PTS lactose/cellobiose transporter subunit IIA [Scrofimicrobium sp. R131]|uniref:PTS lactose/cellobiose transporter subunit IIA n=1 Tax=Scrofimicrobium appendicitidis TaxID=3079930 RepID=A0AAU7V9X0_9ACTO